MKMPEIKRGTIWRAALGEGQGSEQNGNRPVLVIQNDVGNRFSSTVIVAALTDSKDRYMPTHVHLLHGRVRGLPKDSVILLEQIRTIDKGRLLGYIGELSESTMEEVNYALGVSVGIIATKPKKDTRM